MTKQQLQKFIKIRNESDFASNLQFLFDAERAGIEIRDLGFPKKDYQTGDTEWKTPFGTLKEGCGILTLE